MSCVNRYSLVVRQPGKWESAKMACESNGNFVRFEDYERLRMALERIADPGFPYACDQDDCTPLSHRIDDARATLNGMGISFSPSAGEKHGRTE